MHKVRPYLKLTKAKMAWHKWQSTCLASLSPWTQLPELEKKIPFTKFVELKQQFFHLFAHDSAIWAGPIRTNFLCLSCCWLGWSWHGAGAPSTKIPSLIGLASWWWLWTDIGNSTALLVGTLVFLHVSGLGFSQHWSLLVKLFTL
jgi:hypothetical protein